MTDPTRERRLALALGGLVPPPVGWTLRTSSGVPPRLQREHVPDKPEGIIADVLPDASLTSWVSTHHDLQVYNKPFPSLGDAVDEGERLVAEVARRNAPKREIELDVPRPRAAITVDYLRALVKDRTLPVPVGWSRRSYVPDGLKALERRRPDGTVMTLYLCNDGCPGEGAILYWTKPDGIGPAVTVPVELGSLWDEESFDLVESFWLIEDFVRAEEGRS